MVCESEWVAVKLSQMRVSLNIWACRFLMFLSPPPLKVVWYESTDSRSHHVITEDPQADKCPATATRSGCLTIRPRWWRWPLTKLTTTREDTRSPDFLRSGCGSPRPRLANTHHHPTSISRCCPVRSLLLLRDVFDLSFDGERREVGWGTRSVMMMVRERERERGGLSPGSPIPSHGCIRSQQLSLPPHHSSPKDFFFYI